MRRWSWITLAASLALTLPALAQHDHHAASPPAAATQALYTPADLQFLSHMIIHHEQALAMCALVHDRTDRDEFRRFAGYVARAQGAEIEMMRGMLRLAAERGLPVPEHAPHGDPPMAGMLSSAEMEVLAAASGAGFERLWLEGMIFHHEGGLAMARVQELIQQAEGRRPPGLEVMVDDILVEQRAEIGKMRGWLAEWGLADDADRRAPTAEVSIPASGASLHADAPTTLYGVAVDDRAIARVEIGVQSLGAGVWLQSDGSWGERTPLAPEVTGSGPGSAAWRLVFTPPEPGRYGVTAEVEDGAGRRSEAAREIEAE